MKTLKSYLLLCGIIATIAAATSALAVPVGNMDMRLGLGTGFDKSADALLLESGDYLLLESGDRLLLEGV